MCNLHPPDQSDLKSPRPCQSVEFCHGGRVVGILLEKSVTVFDGFSKSSRVLTVHQFSSTDIQERWKHSWFTVTCVTYIILIK